MNPSENMVWRLLKTVIVSSLKKEAVVNNTIPFIYNYILINGQKGKTYFSVNFNDEAVTVPDKFLGRYRCAIQCYGYCRSNQMVWME